jgi:hypothetical protein
MRYTHIQEYYSAIKRNRVLTHHTRQMNLENNISEIKTEKGQIIV